MKNGYAKIAVFSNYATLKIVQPTDLPWPSKKIKANSSCTKVSDAINRRPIRRI